MQRRFFVSLLILALSLMSLTAKAQVSLRLVVDAPFCLYAEEPYKEMMCDPVTYCTLPKGTMVEILGHSWRNHFVQVSLSDGSLGYIPTLAVAFSDVSVTINGGEWVDSSTGLRGGVYKLHSIEGWKDFQPKAFTLKNEKGKSFRFASSSNILVMSKYTKVLEMFGYGDFFERNMIPYYKEDRDDKVIRMSLKDGELPMTLLGCSKSYIDNLLSPPLGYAGPSVSEYDGYVYGFYENVIWPMFEEVRDNFWGAGILIYYDKELTAVHMEKMPWTFDFKPVHTKLRAPKQPVQEIAATAVDDLAKAKRKPRYKEAAPLVETYSAPEGMQSTVIDMMYIFENKFGITNRWAILGILLAVLLVIQVFAYIIVRKFYTGPNKYIGVVTFLFVLPFLVYAMIYVGRFYIIDAIIALFMVMGCSLYGSIFLSVDADENRCDRCRSWLGTLKYNFKGGVVNQERGKSDGKPSAIMVSATSLVPSVSSPSSKLGWGTLLSRSSNSAVVDGVRHTESSREWNFRTTVTISWNSTMRLKCPKCGHEWNCNAGYSEEVPGPIFYTVYSDSSSEWKETETIQWVRRSDGTVVHEESHDIDRSSSSSSVLSRQYDLKIYNIYLNRYINGDKSALYEYERLRLGHYDGVDED